MIMKASIVLPFYNQWNLTHARLSDLHTRVPEPCEIVLVNDASTEKDVVRGSAWWQDNDAVRHTIKYVNNKENLGFGGSHNRGAKAATGDILIFLSNDVVIRTDFVTPIVDALEVDPNILLGGRIVFWPAGWNEFKFDGKELVIPYCEGWLLACTRDIWDNLGGFDTKTFGKFDYEDIDLSANALVHGHDLVSLNLPDTKLKHLSGVTIRSLGVDRQKITEKNRGRFIKKWRSKFGLIYDTLEKMTHEREGAT